MSIIFLLSAGGVSGVLVIVYLVYALRCRKHGKDKKQISDELVELLKE